MDIDIDKISETELAMKLREIAVKEWQTNAQDYQGFLASSSVEDEAELFLTSGHFNCALGDLVPLAISNAFGISIILFTSNQSHSVINVTPRQLKISVPIYLAYLQHGDGHYDAVVPDNDSLPSVSPTTSTELRCTCGKNDKTHGSHCQPISTKYATMIKCKCLQAQVGC